MNDRPYVLGLASSHNGGACLLHGDEILVAIQEERLLRQKRSTHPSGAGSLSVQYCLEAAGLEPGQLSMIVSAAVSDRTVPSDDVSLNAQLRAAHHHVPVVSIGHHRAHAIGVFATSGFADASILIVDGTGSPFADVDDDERRVTLSEASESCARNPQFRETVSMFAGQCAAVTPLEKHFACSLEGSETLDRMRPFWSLGSMYEHAAGQVFRPDRAVSGIDDAGKLMGLAAYGKPSIPADAFYRIVDGQFRFSSELHERFLPCKEVWPERAEEYADLAASAQLALEEALLYLLRRLRELSPSRRLCYAGGVALNSVANERILHEAGFDDVYIMPAAEDSGTAIGAAYAGLWQLTGHNTQRRLRHDAVGRKYSSEDVDRAIAQQIGIQQVRTTDYLDAAVDMIERGKIVGWFSGRSELGPRALGQRSIVCDPRDGEMKARVNACVKFRESFRPFAPAILLDHVPQWFEMDGASTESPFMLRVMRFQAACAARVPAVVHVDGTGRPQTLTKEENGAFYELVSRFHQRTGIPLLLNTSFNVSGEPLVESPADAMWSVVTTALDGCVIDGRIVTKADSFRSILDWHPILVAERIGVDCPVADGREIGGELDGEVDDVASYLLSFPLDRIAEIERYACVLRRPHVRLVAMTPWGRVLQVAQPRVLPLLRLLDGSRTGWEVLERVRQSYGPRFTEALLVRSFAELRRASVLSFSCSCATKPSPMDRQRTSLEGDDDLSR